MITPHIMIPLVGEVKELKFVKDVVVKVADELIAAAGVEMKYQVGTMIEIPCSLTAGEIAKEAEFFSFGTNDLTQMTFGFSRDDAAKFLGAYYENKIYESDPFQHLDQIGVGKLVKMAAHDGRETRPDLGLGICGEHGATPRAWSSATMSVWTTSAALPSVCLSHVWLPLRLLLKTESIRFYNDLTLKIERKIRLTVNFGGEPYLFAHV